MTFPHLFFMIVDRDFPDHWKTVLLRQLTGLPNASELPLRLWGYCESRRDDFIAGDGGMIAGICRAALPPKDLLKALLECRFLDKTKGGYVVHGWRERNAAWLAKIEAGKNRIQRAGRNASGQLTNGEHPASNQLAGSMHPANPGKRQLAGSMQAASNDSAGAVEWSGVEKSREPADPPPRGAGGSAQCSVLSAQSEPALDVLTETSNRILQLFGAAKKRRLGREAEGELGRNAEALPLVETEWELLAWWLSLPAEESDPYLRDGSRPKDADKLAIRLFTELDRAKGHAKKSGPVLLKKEAAPEPADWRVAMAAEFPSAEIPATWAEFQVLGASIRERVIGNLKIAKKEGGAL